MGNYTMSAPTPPAALTSLTVLPPPAFSPVRLILSPDIGVARQSRFSRAVSRAPRLKPAVQTIKRLHRARHLRKGNGQIKR